MAGLPEHESAVDIIARVLSAVSPNERLEALRRFEGDAAGAYGSDPLGGEAANSDVGP